MSDASVMKGVLEVVGPHNDLAEGSEYAYLRFKEPAGAVRMVKKVGVGHYIASYIKPGLEGEFHFMKLGRLGFILYAIKTTSGEKIYEADGFSSWIKKMRIMGLLMCLLFIPLSLVGMLFGGYFGVVVPVVFVYVIWKLLVSFPKVLKDTYLRAQLAGHGFTV
ncbi:hypothetical protein PPUJ13061_55910 [Pseudomonas putida]|uniref:hypothetical protein n=1 Tax=Pseudomonas putida TaxID=303 RepID=UPI000E0D9D78|nr:hypothetical protein [Pseudomonas putida]WQE52198.1 hypothetical protein U0028_20285 [Pseudomonas putida]GLO05687.1 hypothetical protein PPUJ13061_55910 [Pseudomonas putida]HDS1009115.1 hypothetical protein [Pseudomonas putida]